MAEVNFLTSKIKYGFTLAEVLITLVIVGVIAALTIPSVINNTKKQEFVAGVKKAYSSLAQATNKIMTDEGLPRADIGGWATSDDAVLDLYKKYLGAKDCPLSSCLSQYSTTGPKGISGNSTSRDLWNTERGLLLADGMQLVVGHTNSQCNYGSNGGKCFEIFVDINGQKRPNQYGRDVFVFAVNENGFGISTTNDCDPSLSGSVGWACSAKVLRENAMNY